MSSTDQGPGNGAGKRESPWRATIITFFPMAIAVLSLVTSIYNGYLNNRFVTLIQGNLGRSEYMRTCRDVIDAYFQVKYRADVLRAEAQKPVATNAEAAAVVSARIEAGHAVARFGALATYLANLRNEDIRALYTQLYGRLNLYVATAAAAADSERAKVLAEADASFARLNDDCVKSATALP